jgi:hypothetical protein
MFVASQGTEGKEEEEEERLSYPTTAAVTVWLAELTQSSTKKRALYRNIKEEVWEKSAHMHEENASTDMSHNVICLLNRHRVGKTKRAKLSVNQQSASKISLTIPKRIKTAPGI